MKFWLVRPIIRGFELHMIMCGSEDGVKEYVQNQLPYPVAYTDIGEDAVRAFEKAGFKVYYAFDPTTETNKNDM